MGSCWIWCIPLGAAICAAAPLASAQAVPESLRACAAEADDLRRLACFDREMARLGESHAPAPAPAPMLSAEERFGMQGELARKLEKEKGIERPELEKLEAQVSEVGEKPRGELIVTLDNGQVWEQVEAKTGFRLRSGDSVTITPGALRSFWLQGESGRQTRVRRVR